MRPPKARYVQRTIVAMNGYSDAGNSYAKCEGLIDELLYYFIRYRQCSSGGKKKLAQTYSAAEVT
jgi:hypothetical protein